MFCAFGPVSFNVIASPSKNERSKKYHWEYIYVIGAPPLVQWVYDAEKRIDLTIMLHQMWCNPQSALSTLEQLADLHTQQALVFGNGQNIGNFIIVELRDKMIWQADDGTIIATEVTLSLAEFPGATAPVTNYPQDITIGNPPGLTTSQNASPGSTLVVSPAATSPPGITPQTPFTDIPFSTIARQAA